MIERRCLSQAPLQRMLTSTLGVRRFPVLRADERELREFAPAKIERGPAKKTHNRENA
jgi:hypothetical protein